MKSRWKKFLVMFVLLHVIVLVTAQYCFSGNPEKLYARALKNKPYDAIIIPGIPYDGKDWNKIMKARVLWSKYLYDQGITKNVIYSGAAVHSPYVEAKVMAMYAEQLGIPKEHIYIEDKAQHSVENLYYSWGIAQAMDFKKLAVATDPGQSAMLGSFIWKWSLKIDRIPMVKSLMDSMPQPGVLAIDAEAAFVKDYVPFNTKNSFWKQWSGTIGNSINFNVVPPSIYSIKSSPVTETLDYRYPLGYAETKKAELRPPWLVEM